VNKSRKFPRSALINKNRHVEARHYRCVLFYQNTPHAFTNLSVLAANSPFEHETQIKLRSNCMPDTGRPTDQVLPFLTSGRDEQISRHTFHTLYRSVSMPDR
jgi:hypothetical protein